MARRLLYLAYGYWADRPAASAPYEFLCAVDAEEGGLILSKSADGVLVVQQWADVEAQIFDEPEILAEYGSVPRAAKAIDADGREPWLDDAA